MIKNICENSHSYDYDPNSGVRYISELERRYNDKKRLVEDVKYDFELQSKALYKAYQSYVDYFSFFPNYFARDIQKWLSCLSTKKAPDGTKLDGRRAYKEKTNYLYSVEQLKKFLDNEDIELKNVYSYNFSEGWEYIFTCNGIKFMLTVPNVASVSYKSFECYHDYVFKIKLSYYKSECITELIYSTFDEDTIKIEFNKFLSKKEKK